jgi:transcriptional regulator with XRE-family HTH domain
MAPPAHPATASAPSEADRVLTKAVVRAGERLGLTQRELAGILGVSPATLSRLARVREPRLLEAASKEGELAVQLLRVYRSLDALLGGDDEANRRWLRAENHHLGGVPAALLQTVTGLVHVAEYLDAMRGKG